MEDAHRIVEGTHEHSHHSKNLRAYLIIPKITKPNVSCEMRLGRPGP